ncbi:MATE family efflux transporter [uncultured Methanomethylovorans sp.]|uniref:MATE family efflux transporter n=1 Tax=uncultured Methanomethylovorans sp. TaxID=183759 RepID=UPI002AA72156|nr:MATE family efflux transporter [uncultured Methanomethylovorans sp.]
MGEKSDFLGKDNVRKLLFKFSTPIIIGMLVQALYNVVDTFFVGLAYGTNSVQAIGGLCIAFPVQMIIMAFGIVLGTGGSSIISRALGARNNEKAERVLGNVFSLSLLLSVLIAVPCLLYLEPILKVFGATAGVLPYARDYLKYIILGGIFSVFGVAVQNIIRSEGNSRLAMNAMLVGGGLNILLDPIFMFGYGMGVEGAAIATVLSQAVVSIWLLLYYLKGKGAIHFKSQNLKPYPEIIKEIGAIGTGSFIMGCSNSLMMIVVYNILAIFGGDVAIAVLGVVMKINSFIFLPLLGMGFGLQPIVGFNYGGKKYDRIVEAVKMALGTPLIGLNVVASIFFQALGRAKPAFILSISRQLLFLIPAVVLLPRFYGLNGAWAAFPVSDLLAFMLSGFMLFRAYRVFEKSKKSIG